VKAYDPCRKGLAGSLVSVRGGQRRKGDVIKPKLVVIIAVSAILATSSLARAHICNVWLTPINPNQSQQPDPTWCNGEAEQVHVDAAGVVTASDTSGAYTGYGWATSAIPRPVTLPDGTPRTVYTLADSHQLHGATVFTFYLASRYGISIAVHPGGAGDAGAGEAGAAAQWDPAFTVYRGVLPLMAHDDTSYDPLNPIDDTTVYFLPARSRVDSIDGDPNIPQTTVDLGGNLITNPAWDGAAALQYSSLYVPRSGFRDTLNGTTVGGRYPADYADPNFAGALAFAYLGQFDALGDWSMATEDLSPGETDPSVISQRWAKISYLFHSNGTGPGESESVQGIPFEAGEYTIAVDGANCALWQDTDTDHSCAALQYLTGTVEFRAEPLDVDGGNNATDDGGDASVAVSDSGSLEASSDAGTDGASEAGAMADAVASDASGDGGDASVVGAPSDAGDASVATSDSASRDASVIDVAEAAPEGRMMTDTVARADAEDDAAGGRAKDASAGGSAGTIGGADASQDTAANDSGCSCRTAPGHGPGSGLLIGMCIVTLARRRRSRSRLTRMQRAP